MTKKYLYINLSILHKQMNASLKILTHSLLHVLKNLLQHSLYSKPNNEKISIQQWTYNPYNNNTNLWILLSKHWITPWSTQIPLHPHKCFLHYLPTSTLWNHLTLFLHFSKRTITPLHLQFPHIVDFYSCFSHIIGPTFVLYIFFNIKYMYKKIIIFLIGIDNIMIHSPWIVYLPTSTT